MNSTIDYALCNEKIYESFINTVIDEEWEVFEISDQIQVNYANYIDQKLKR